ncbi:MAG: adenine phosphoribosyltransferase [Lentisphaeria bacterium]|nr:adenine phosphoribosyltransferase [Lentisphaeria bacterium]
MSLETLTAAIRDIPDFPKPGIMFKDISPILQDGALFAEVIDIIGARYENQQIDSIVVIDARGFIFGSALAYKLGCGISLVRKQGKLPWKTYSVSYELEYGSAAVEIHIDAVSAGDRVLIVDDLLATGGTARAGADLIEKIGARIIALEFVIELSFLNGRDKLDGYTVNSLIEVSD